MIRASEPSRGSSRGNLWFYLVVGLAAAGLALGGAAPLFRKQARLHRDMREVDQRLEQTRPPPGAPPLARQLESERRRYRRLLAEWEGIQPRLQPLHRKAVLDASPGIFEGRIDLKIAILNVRRHLDSMARKQGTLLPSRLEIPETIERGELAETRLGQLAATSEIMKAVIQIGVPEILAAEALPPVWIPPPDSGHPMLVFYPVYLEMNATTQSFPEALRKLASPERMCFPRRLYIESGFPDHPRRLRIRGVWSAAALPPRPSVATPARSLEP